MGLIGRSFAAWATDNAVRLEEAQPAIPAELDDRAADIWEPLFAIADALGGDWPQRARRAAIALSTGDIRDDAHDYTIAILLGCKTAFGDKAEISTADLCKALHENEDVPPPPRSDWWATDREGIGQAPRKSTDYLARVLKDFDPRIKPRLLGTGNDRYRGYERKYFEPEWERYEAPPTPSSSQGVPHVPHVPNPHSSMPSDGTTSAAQGVPEHPNVVPESQQNGSVLLPGDDLYIAFIETAVEKGHLTELEYQKQVALHYFLRPDLTELELAL